METKATQSARMLLGLIFFVFGPNGFFRFIPLFAVFGLVAAEPAQGS